jgi:RNA polymerase sigma-70 factor, ECF subfamily
MVEAPLTALFLPSLRKDARIALESFSELESMLRGMAVRGRAAWPVVDVTDAAFLTYLAERVPSRSPDAYLAGARAEDLFLACGCLHHDPAALRMFDERFLGPTARALSRLNQGTLAQDDSLQAVREILLVGRGGRAPGLARFGGRGDLLGWVRAAAIRIAMRSERKSRTEDPLSSTLEYASSVEGADPELSYLRSVHGETFDAALADSLASLPPRQRSLLRLHYHQGLTIDELAGLYRIHRSTAARWVADARHDFVDATRFALLERLQVGPSTLRSLARALKSELDTTLSRMLSRSSDRREHLASLPKP